MVEALRIVRNPEALSVLKQAFADHPVLPLDTPAKTREALLRLMLDTFGRADNAWMHGIRKDGSLACVAFSLDSRSQLELSDIVWFFFKLFCVVGWRRTRGFIRGFSNREEYHLPYLELMLLGTLPAFQGEGLGKTMLAFLYGFAKAQQYNGVVLSTARETPAFRFYINEGFVVDREITMNDIPLCYMRRDNTE
jgi:GNAT superfamily N-acetyltransferase